MRTLILAWLFALLPAPALAASIDAVRLSHAESTTRLVIDLPETRPFKVFSLDHPPRIVIDIENTRANPRLTLPEVDQTAILAIRQAQFTERSVRIVLDLRQPVRFETRELLPMPGLPPRLVIDMHGYTPIQLAQTPRTPEAQSTQSTPPAPPASAANDRTAHNAPTAPSTQPSTAISTPPEPAADRSAEITPVIAPTAPPPSTRSQGPRRDIVIAIDPGHGGKDPGAIGQGGTREKDVVLQISRRLAALIDAEPGMRAYMTRDSDVFITLRQRIQRARANGADLFISIHADAAPNRRARGSSVYVLSERGASSEAAQILAQRENAADLIGGISLEDKDDLLASVLLDLSQTASLEASVEVASNVLFGLQRVGNVHKRQVESANFAVLKSPDIPSILVETAFISNAEEEQRLRNPDQQQRLAQAMMNGIRTYFQRNPITDSIKPQEHIVSRGETLSGIAQRYRVNTRELMAANNLKDSQLQAGKVLRIP